MKITSKSNKRILIKTINKSKILHKAFNTIGKKPNSNNNYNINFYKSPSLNPNQTTKPKYSSNNYLSNNSKSKYTVALISNSYLFNQ